MVTLKKRIQNYSAIMLDSRSQWQRGVRRKPAAARLLILWVRIPQGYGCLAVVSVMCC
jgi:hypothetical protein